MPLSKPFDLSPWQFAWSVVFIVAAIGLDSFVQLSDEPFQQGTPMSPMLAARVSIVFFGAMIVLYHPGDRWLPIWLLVAIRHGMRTVGRVRMGIDWDGERVDQRTYFNTEAEQMQHMKLTGEGVIFLVNPPFWSVMRRLPFGLADAYWKRHVPYRLLLPVESQGSLELKTDDERSSLADALTAGLKALTHPVAIYAQARPEDPDWLVEHAVPPQNSPFAFMAPFIERWVRQQATRLNMRRIVVTCSAPDEHALVQHVSDVNTALSEAGLTVRESTTNELLDIFDQVFGARHFYPDDINSFGVDDTDWVTIVVRRFPRSVVIGWLMFIVAGLQGDLALYLEPDDATWVTKLMEWFEGACGFATASTEHHDALDDLRFVEAKLKRLEDSVQRCTLLLTVPKHVAPRIKNRLRKAGAAFHEAMFEHEDGRFATLPKGGLPGMGVTRPYDGASAAGCFPFGASGLRMRRGTLIGTARMSQQNTPEVASEAVVLDILHKSLYAKMIAILGTTGAGKTFLMQLLIERTGLPFTLIDLKPHFSERQHGDFYPFVRACNGQYIVVTPAMLDEGIPFSAGPAVCYNLASLKTEEDKARALYEIAEHEWDAQLESLEWRIFGCDEANLLAKTRAGRDYIERVATQGRNAGMVGIFASQEVWDFLKNEQTRKAISMSSMLFALAQDHSEVDRIADALKLGAAATTELRKFQPKVVEDDDPDNSPRWRNAILRVGNRIVSFKIEACPEEVALFTTDPEDKRARRKDVARVEHEKELVTA